MGLHRKCIAEDKLRIKFLENSLDLTNFLSSYDMGENDPPFISITPR